MYEMGGNLSSEQWCCEKCTLINQGRFAVCQACGNQKQVNPGWTCRNCSSPNPSSIIQCNSCRSLRFNQSSTASENESRWICPRCTLSNSCKSDVCSACKLNRSLEVADSSEDRGRRGRSFAERVYPNLTLELYPEIAQQSSEVLKCPRCQSLLYDNVGSYCTVCRSPCPEDGFKPRPFPSSSLPSSSKDFSVELWSCPGCTLYNNVSASKCEVCGTTRQGEGIASGNPGEISDEAGK